MIDAGTVHVRDSGGDGPPVLLLHGWAVTADLNFFTANSAEYPFFEGLTSLTFSLSNPYVVAGLLIGGLLSERLNPFRTSRGLRPVSG